MMFQDVYMVIFLNSYSTILLCSLLRFCFVFMPMNGNHSCDNCQTSRVNSKTNSIPKPQTTKPFFWAGVFRPIFLPIRSCFWLDDCNGSKLKTERKVCGRTSHWPGALQLLECNGNVSVVSLNSCSVEGWSWVNQAFQPAKKIVFEQRMAKYGNMSQYVHVCSHFFFFKRNSPVSRWFQSKNTNRGGISACEKGNQWQCAWHLGCFHRTTGSKKIRELAVQIRGFLRFEQRFVKIFSFKS